jgi:hypothetical protein
VFEPLGEHDCRPFDGHAVLSALLAEGWYEHRHVRSRTAAETICSAAEHTGHQAMRLSAADGFIILIRSGAGAADRS